MWEDKDIQLLVHDLKKQTGKEFILKRKGPSLLFKSSDLAARISHKSTKSILDVKQEKKLIEWLSSYGFETIKIKEGPETVLGHPALFYQWIKTDNTPFFWEGLGRDLAYIHSLSPPPFLRKYSPALDYQKRVEVLKKNKIINDDQALFILNLGDEGVALFEENQSSSSVFLHGDIHTGNVLLQKEGPILIDWEDASLGPLEVDFSSIFQRKKFFNLSEKDFFLFEKGYQRKIKNSPATQGMISLRIANSITHLLLGDAKRQEEGYKRLSDLMLEKRNFNWQDV